MRSVLQALLALTIFMFVASCATTPKPAMEGTASWYGERFHGRKTANGERFNMYKLTAAHRTLPFGTLVRVTSLSSQKSVVVRINDRGPFAYDCIIDLSYAAARKLDLIAKGHDQVVLERLSPATQQLN
jgi:rare lipoprotein A